MKHIVIVGGGTSGWMAAIALSSHFPDKQISVIEPSHVAPIGVGESVTGAVFGFVNYPFHGLSLSEFFRNSDATLKLGVRYRDWLGTGTEYLSPIDYPPDVFDHHYFEDMEDFYALLSADGKSICEEHIHGKLMRANRTDYFRQPDATVCGDLSTASCHVDALKFAGWLKDLSCRRENITYIDDAVRGFAQDPESGLITKVVTENGQDVIGDFFLDCTGFRRILFQAAYAPQWIDLSQHIKVDSAIPSFAPHAEGHEIPVYTVAKAMPHGWMWQIPTQSRLGRGYVFSSQYVSDEQALEDCAADGVVPVDDLRIIRFKPGKFRTQWQGNVCAIGLAGGFIEPLESTTIHIMHVQIKALTELFLPYYKPPAASALARKYNGMIDTMYNDFVDFVSFHYRTGRRDTEFWRDYQSDASLTDRNKARLETWAHAYPAREDFAPLHTDRFVLTTGIIVWMPMLCGLGLLNRDAALELITRSKLIPRARANLAKYQQVRDFLCGNAVSQREAVAWLRGDAGLRRQPGIAPEV